MKYDRKIGGRTVRRNVVNRRYWDVLEQCAGQLTGRVTFTGTLREIRRALSDIDAVHAWKGGAQ